MMANIGLQMASLVYIILLAIVFLSTRKTITAENKIFSLLIITNMIYALADIGAITIAAIKPEYVSTIIMLEKLEKILFIAFLLSFTEYAILIINKNLTGDQKLKIYSKHYIVFSICIISFSLLIFILPSNGSTALNNSYGLDMYFCYFINLVCMIIWVWIVLKTKNKLDKKNVIPITISIIFGSIGMVIQYLFPDIHTILVATTYSVAVMYFTVFTIDNPDIKMIEEMTAAKNEAERANQSKTDFLADMSHEIRTPLNAILGFSQGLLEEKIPDNARNDVEDIISASDSLLDIVNEILDISRIETNKLEIVNVEYSIEKLYKYLVSLTEGRIGSKQLEFIHECDEKLPEVLYGDNIRIRQIAVNLLTNSVKYTREGYIKLTITGEKIDEDNCNLIISVEDSGIGIKEENLEKLFSKFERFDLKENINIEGTGLGLSLTKKLVDLMNGEIKVESKYGEGSKFIVKVKQQIVHKSLDELEAHKLETNRQKFIGHGEKVLIVDDNMVNLKVACRLLKKYKLNIELSESGQDCINKISKSHYDLILLDDMMPKMSGVETLQKLRTDPNFKIPTVALTANAITGMKEKYLQAGFDDYLSKPIDKQLLEDVLIKFFGTEDDTISIQTPKESENQEEKKQKLEIPIVNQMPELLPSPEIKKEEIEELEVLDDFEENDSSTEQPSTKESSKEESTPTGNEKGNVEYLKSQGVDLDKALELLGDMEMYNDTVNDFVSEIDNKINDIKKFHDASDMPNYAILVHSLKSDSKYIGLMHLAELAYNHEMASKGNDVNYVNEHYDELMKEANKMIQVIKNYAGV